MRAIVLESFGGLDSLVYKEIPDPEPYSEDFSNDSSVMSADSLKIAFRVHIVWRVLPDRVEGVHRALFNAPTQRQS